MSRGAIPEAPEQRATEGSETDRLRGCPLCEFVSEEQADIYVHLQTGHRKSTLATAILDDATEP